MGRVGPGGRHSWWGKQRFRGNVAWRCRVSINAGLAGDYVLLVYCMVGMQLWMSCASMYSRCSKSKQGRCS